MATDQEREMEALKPRRPRHLSLPTGKRAEYLDLRAREKKAEADRLEARRTEADLAARRHALSEKRSAVAKAAWKRRRAAGKANGGRPAKHLSDAGNAMSRTARTPEQADYLAERKAEKAVAADGSKRLWPRPGYVSPVVALDRLLVASLNKRPVPVANVIPTVRADPATKGVPYRMASSLVDPFREARRRQAMKASVGRI